MGWIREEIQYDELPVTVTVVEREKGESIEPWRFIDIELDGFDRMSPPEMRRLGHWLVKEGKRIGREFKSNGAPRYTEQTGG